MSASVLGALALLCFAAVVVSVFMAVRDVEFLNVLTDETYYVGDAPNLKWLAAAACFLIAFVIFGVGALFKSGLA